MYFNTRVSGLNLRVDYQIIKVGKSEAALIWGYYTQSGDNLTKFIADNFTFDQLKAISIKALAHSKTKA